MDFKVGDSVICIDQCPDLKTYTGKYYDKIMTISKLTLLRGTLFIHLKESIDCTAAWYATRFKKVNRQLLLFEID